MVRHLISWFYKATRLAEGFYPRTWAAVLEASPAAVEDEEDEDWKLQNASSAPSVESRKKNQKLHLNDSLIHFNWIKVYFLKCRFIDVAGKSSMNTKQEEILTTGAEKPAWTHCQVKSWGFLKKKKLFLRCLKVWVSLHLKPKT